MDGRSQWGARRRRQQRLSRVLVVAAAVVLLGGLFGQIAVRARISAQVKQIDAVRGEIQELDASVRNLDLCINQHHNLETIGDRARELGMEEPVDDQLRVVNLPQVEGDTSTQTVASGEGEKISG